MLVVAAFVALDLGNLWGGREGWSIHGFSCAVIDCACGLAAHVEGSVGGETCGEEGDAEMDGGQGILVGY